MTSNPLVRRTFATLRSAEFGFFGVVVYTRVQTPRFCGFCSIAGTFDLAFCGSRPLRTSWLIVGMKPFTFMLPANSGGYFAGTRNGKGPGGRTDHPGHCISSNVQRFVPQG